MPLFLTVVAFLFGSFSFQKEKEQKKRKRNPAPKEAGLETDKFT